MSSVTNSVLLPLDEVYRELERNLRGELIPVIQLPRHSTRGVVAEHISNYLAEDHTPVWFRVKKPAGFYDDLFGSKERSSGAVATSSHDNRSALTPIEEPVRTLPILVHNQQENVPFPPSRPASIRDDLRKIAQDTEYHGPPFVTVDATPLQVYLPSVRGSALLELLDEEEMGATVKLQDVQMLWDTGAPITYISSDLLDDDFHRQLYQPDYVSMYQWGRPELAMCMISIRMEFSNSSIYLDGVAVVCSMAQMPNNHSGIILGQRSILDRLVYTTEPRHTLLARGFQVPSHVWGKIQVKGYVNMPAEGGEYVQVE